MPGAPKTDAKTPEKSPAPGAATKPDAGIDQTLRGLLAPQPDTPAKPDNAPPKADSTPPKPDSTPVTPAKPAEPRSSGRMPEGLQPGAGGDNKPSGKDSPDAWLKGLSPEMPKQPSGDAAPPQPELPQSPKKDSGLPGGSGAAERTPKGGVAARPPAAEIRADWTESLSPELVSHRVVRQTSYVKPAADPAAPVARGFCLVELCEHERWVTGEAAHKTVFQGQTYLFSSADAKGKFLAAPERYVPGCQGNDPVISIEENRQVAGKVEYSAIYRGRLYLFSGTATLAQFREEPRRYATTGQNAKARSVD